MAGLVTVNKQLIKSASKKRKAPTILNLETSYKADQNQMLTELQKESILRELSYQTSRSGGKGGQNVNKVESRVEISFDIQASEALTPQQKELLLRKATLVNESQIKIVASKHRSQLENKEEARKKLLALIDRLLKPVKKRVPTKPGKAAKQKKLDEKKRVSEKKSYRQKNFGY